MCLEMGTITQYSMGSGAKCKDWSIDNCTFECFGVIYYRAAASPQLFLHIKPQKHTHGGSQQTAETPT